jgi:molybdopterin converting factor small subunit
MPLFTPEEKKIFDQEVESVKKGMLANKRALVSKYGKDAEKVVQGNAVKKALKKIENLRQSQEMENNRLKEMVKMALTKPLDENTNLKKGDTVEFNGVKYKIGSFDTEANLVYLNTMDGEPAEDNKGDYLKVNVTRVKPSINEDIDLGHEDNEPHDLKSQLYKIGKYAMELYQTMDQFEGKGEVDFPAWWQNKINTAGNMMSSAKHYIDFELKEPQLGVDIEKIDEEINRANVQQQLKQAFPQLKPYVSVYGNNGEVKFEIKSDVNQNTFNSVINYLEGNNFVVDREQSYPDYEQDDDREWFPRVRFTIKGPNTGTSLPNLGEKKLTSAEKKKKEEIVMAMKKDFKGPEAAMYAIATEKAKKVAEELAKKLKNK